MEVEIKLVANINELEQILSLQGKNHYSNLSEETRRQNGFVTVKHSLDVLKLMNSKAKQIIAVRNGNVIGYALVMTKEVKDLVPVLKPMFQSFDGINYKGKRLSDWNFYVMGQVCIDKSCRGQGVFDKLYSKHKEVYCQTFDVCLTEVSTNNSRSLRAHEKVGFKILKTYKGETSEWNILCWDWS